MTSAKASALAHLNALIEEYRTAERDAAIHRDGGQLSGSDEQYFINRFTHALQRLAPPRSHYEEEIKTAWEVPAQNCLDRLVAAGKGLRAEYQADTLDSFRELFARELNSDYLTMAECLLENDKLKLPAAVVVGAVLEEWIHALCTKNKIDLIVQVGTRTERKKTEVLNADLKKAGVYGLNEQKQITAWLGVRNSAAHGKPDEFTDDHVRLMLQGVRQYLTSFPA